MVGNHFASVLIFVYPWRLLLAWRGMSTFWVGATAFYPAALLFLIFPLARVAPGREIAEAAQKNKSNGGLQAPPPPPE